MRRGVRRVGVEEELLLVDTVTGELRPMAREIIAECGSGHADGVQVKHEFFGSQVEVASSPNAEVDAIRDELRAARTHIAKVGARYGVAPLADPGASAGHPTRCWPPTCRRASVTHRSNATTATWPAVR